MSRPTYNEYRWPKSLSNNVTLDQAAASAAMHSFIIEGAKLLRQITLLCKYLKHAGPQKFRANEH